MLCFRGLQGALLAAGPALLEPVVAVEAVLASDDAVVECLEVLGRRGARLTGQAGHKLLPGLHHLWAAIPAARVSLGWPPPACPLGRICLAKCRRF